MNMSINVGIYIYYKAVRNTATSSTEDTQPDLYRWKLRKSSNHKVSWALYIQASAMELSYITM